MKKKEKIKLKSGKYKIQTTQFQKECEQCGSIIDYNEQYKCPECNKTLCSYCYESHQKFGCK